jgi:regulation of enolase protein 1 (concanavalin A-like superfamily)
MSADRIENLADARQAQALGHLTMKPGIELVEAGRRQDLVTRPTGPFRDGATYLVGPMACTPEREGLRVTFTGFSLKPPLGKNLHDLS